jgi:hypothetical protein
MGPSPPDQCGGRALMAGRDDGPGGNTVFLTHASIEQPSPPLDDDDDRRRIEHGGLKAAKRPWDLGHLPQQNARAVWVHVVCTLLCTHPSISRNDLLSAETIHGVIVHHPRGLHMGIANRGAHEFKTPLAQVLAHRL